MGIKAKIMATVGLVVFVSVTCFALELSDKEKAFSEQQVRLLEDITYHTYKASFDRLFVKGSRDAKLISVFLEGAREEEEKAKGLSMKYGELKIKVLESSRKLPAWWKGNEEMDRLIRQRNDEIQKSLEEAMSKSKKEP